MWCNKLEISIQYINVWKIDLIKYKIGIWIKVDMNQDELPFVKKFANIIKLN